MYPIKEAHPPKNFPYIKSLELLESGAFVITHDDKKIFIKAEHIAMAWGMLSLALDCACLGSLSCKIRRLGFGEVMQSALEGIKTVKVDERQRELPLDEVDD